MKNPTLRPAFSIEQIDDNTTILLAESKQEILDGRAYPAILPLLDGKHDMYALLSKTADKASMPEVMFALNVLGARGVLGDAGEGVTPAADAYWHGMQVTSGQAEDRLRETAVSLRSVGDTPAQPVKDSLASMGVTVEGGESAVDGLTIVLTDDYLREGLRQINQEMIDADKTWLLAKIVGSTLWIGPIFEPNETACYACLAQRLESNRQVQSYILRKTGGSETLSVSRSALPTTIEVGANMIVNAALGYLTKSQNDLLNNTLRTLDTQTLLSEQHAVVRRPQCSVCGDAALTKSLSDFPKPVELKPCKKRYLSDGGHRHLFPEETLATYQHHVSSISGVVSSLTQIGEDDGIVFNYMAGHNFAMAKETVAYLKKSVRAQSGGKGKTRTQAKVSGICEAIERYSGVYRPESTHEIKGNYTSLGDKALRYETYLPFSDWQFENRESINAAISASYNKVPKRYDNTEISWTPIWSLTNQNFRYIPTSFAYYGHPEMKHFFSASDSNGCASGNTIEEAIFQGLLEAIERDAIGMWWFNEIEHKAVNLASFDNDYFNKAMDLYADNNRSLVVLDITNDLGIPIFAGVSARLDGDTDDIVVGFGAHLVPLIGISRAITEVNQSFPSVSQRNEDGTTKYRGLDMDALAWMQNATLEKYPYLAPNGQFKQKSDYAMLHSDDIKEDVEFLVQRLADLGFETFVMDQTLPDVGLSVVRMLVPGLRHMWRRLAQGRLYDVPVQMGWLTEARKEEDLNPWSIYF